MTFNNINRKAPPMIDISTYIDKIQEVVMQHGGLHRHGNQQYDRQDFNRPS